MDLLVWVKQWQYHDDILAERVSEQYAAVSFGWEIIQDFFFPCAQL